MFTFQDGASWLWTRDETPPHNAFACFRHDFNVLGEARDAILHLTADARYELFLNGEWIGEGPPRSWPSPWPVDVYDLRGKLKPGRNALCVLVQDFGISTFQYIKAPSGLLAQLSWRDSSGAQTLVTDANWRAIPHPSFTWSVPRINVQTGWEEQFDARLEPRDEAGRDWRERDFNAASWPSARETMAAGEGAHRAFSLREIPFLSREVREPVRLVRAETVNVAPICLSFNLRDALNADDETANYLLGRMMAAAHFRSKVEQEVELHFPVGFQTCAWKWNGESLQAKGEHLQLTDHPVLRVRARKGWNTLLARAPEAAHSMRASLNAWSESPLHVSATRNESASAWLALGPFEGAPDPKSAPGLLQPFYVQAAQIPGGATDEAWQDIWNRGELSDEELSAPYAQVLGPRCAFDVDVFAECASERATQIAPQIEEPHALLRDSETWTTIHPGEGDTRLLLDWGDELIGYWEIELDAPEGTVVDWQGFEFVQRDGKHNLCDLMNNSFRLVCREGVQRYRTFVRRGFRYAFLSFRNFARPVKVRQVRAIFHTYPAAQEGEFACSDALLERIWRVGAQSVRACSEDAYTDCPSYEQVFWVGDARNEAIVDLTVNGDPRLSAHCWKLAAQSLDRMPLVEATAPSGRPMILPAWTFLWMRWGYEHFLLSGDRAFAREAMPFLDRNFDGLEAHVNDRDLFEIVAWNMFDWAAMETPHDGIVTHQNCLAVLGLRETARLAQLVGETPRAARWNALANRLSRGINAHLWSDERQAYVDCIRADGTLSPVFSQQTQTAAYIAGVCAPPFGSEAREKRCREIIEAVPEGFVSAGSPFFMFFALEAFARQNRPAELVQTIRDYWGPQIEAGATTFWEMYQPHAHRHTRSHCHGWSAAPTFFLTQHALGISPLEPGFSRVRVAPFDGNVSWAQGRVPTPHGVIECAWERNDGAFSLRLSLPRDVCALVELPDEGRVIVDEGEASEIGAQDGKRVLESDSSRLKLRCERKPQLSD